MPPAFLHLLDCLRTPERSLACDDAAWDRLIRLARATNLLARLAVDLEARALLARVPPAPRQHLLAARALERRQAQAVEFEIEALTTALAPLEIAPVLLKGAAYLAAGDGAARGRLFSDIDILIPEHRLDEAESALMQHGWVSLPLSDYDRHYYRTWMHELPPMTHTRRGGGLDVHHALLPRTHAARCDTARLLEKIEASHLPGAFVLCREDRLLHSACHWFFESEFRNGLRDLVDIAALVSEGGREANFGERLKARALQLGLVSPLTTALHLCERHLGLTPPVDLPPAGWRERLFNCALPPIHPLARKARLTLGRAALFIRGHWLRMPPHLLLPHLARKALAPGRKR